MNTNTDTSVSDETSTTFSYLTLSCDICGGICASRVGLASHRRSHRPESLDVQTSATSSDNPVPQHQCTHCEKCFRSKAGLSHHMRQIHPVEYNDQGLQEKNNKRHRWSLTEDSILLTIANDLCNQFTSKKLFHQSLKEFIPHRSLEAIRLRLLTLSWKPSVTPPTEPIEVVDLTPDNTEPENFLIPPLGASTLCDWQIPLVEAAVTELNSAPDDLFDKSLLQSIAQSILTNETDMGSIHQRIETHAISTFPHKWRDTKSRGVRRVGPLSKKAERRAQYAHIQTLYHRRQKDAAKTILNGNWRTAYRLSDEPVPGFAGYWESILQAPAVSDRRHVRHFLPPAIYIDCTDCS